MIKTFFFLLWLSLLSQICISLAYSQASKQSSAGECKEKYIKKLIESLDSTNLLRLALESGDRGNSEHQTWMDKMAQLSIRQASYKIHFLTGTDPVKVNVISSNYYYNYFDYDAPISEKTRKKLRESGLEDELTKVALDKASRQPDQVIANFRRQYPDLAGNNKVFCGEIYINLLDDEALPSLEQISTIESECRQD